jgi:hypothetical protein
MGAFPLLGIDRTSWNKEHEKDLVALRARERHDPFSGWFTERFIPAFHHIVGSKFKVHSEKRQDEWALILLSDLYQRT